MEVKYDRFGKRDEGTWQRPLIILTTKDRSSEHLTYVTDVVQPEETNRWKSINIHTHTHTHTHTHKTVSCFLSVVCYRLFLFKVNKVSSENGLWNVSLTFFGYL